MLFWPRTGVPENNSDIECCWSYLIGQHPLSPVFGQKHPGAPGYSYFAQLPPVFGHCMSRFWPFYVSIRWATRRLEQINKGHKNTLLDGDRITNYNQIGESHRITDYKVNRPIKLAITRILFWNIGTTHKGPRINITKTHSRYGRRFRGEYFGASIVTQKRYTIVTLCCRWSYSSV